MAERQYHLKIDGDKARAVDEYLEYRRIVGDDDGGKLFTPEEYEQYKKRIQPMRTKNRLFTCWTNSTGLDCKLVGPETPCFCQHRYKQHKTDFKVIPDTRPLLLPCKVPRCACATYHYVPLMSGRPIRCTCKHTADEHSPKRPYLCAKSICQKCSGFKSSFSCGCGESYPEHTMVVETTEEREARGHPVGETTLYQAQGGLTGFSSLAEGYMRLDPSGRGAPCQEWLGQEITANDHTFLRAAVPSIQARRRDRKGIQDDYERLDEDMAERISAMKTAEEDDMAYFERRYQERKKAERLAARGLQLPPESESRPHTGQRNTTNKQKEK